MKIIILVTIIVIIGIFLVGGILVWRYMERPLPILALPSFGADSRIVSITTDKTEYKQGEVIRITVKNNSAEGVCYFTYQGGDCYKTPYSVYRFVDEDLIILRTGDPSIFCIQVISPPICEQLVESGKFKVFIWSQKIMENICQEYKEKAECQTPSGKYKISFGIGDLGEIYSNEFTIVVK